MANEPTTLDVTFLFPNLSDIPRKDLAPRLAWSVRCVFDKALLPIVKELGMHIKKDVDDNTSEVVYSFTAKQNYLNPKTGDVFRKPVILDNNNKLLKGELIGNGSTGKIKISIFEYMMDGKPGKAATLLAMKVTNLIKYEAEIDPEFEINEDENDEFAVEDSDY
jgi:hypothetical protein